MVNDLSVLATKEGYRLERVRGGWKETALLRFRHRIFREELRWLPVTSNGLDRDEYDAFSENFGVFVNQCVVGSVRITPGHQRFMLEKEFAALLPMGWALHKGAHSAEVTRLAVETNQHGRRHKQAVMLLYHCLYRWAEQNGVRWMYGVVELPLFRLYARLGFPIFAIGEAKLLDGGVVSQAGYFDWHQASPDFIRWVRQVVEFSVDQSNEPSQPTEPIDCPASQPDER
jgi:N-acyl-L-homoserine lactone synthetase